MKKLIVSMMAVSMLTLCSTLAQAQQAPEDVEKQQIEEQVEARKKARPKAKKATAGQRGRGGRKREMRLDKRLNAIDKQIGGRKKAHVELVAQLKAIKNQAKKEGAEKTVEMLDKLIELQEKKFKSSVKRLEKNKGNAAKQLGKREKQAKGQPEADVKKEAEATAKKEAKEEVREEGKKKKKWWQVFDKD